MPDGISDPAKNGAFPKPSGKIFIFFQTYSDIFLLTKTSVPSIDAASGILVFHAFRQKRYSVFHQNKKERAYV